MARKRRMIRRSSIGALVPILVAAIVAIGLPHDELYAQRGPKRNSGTPVTVTIHDPAGSGVWSDGLGAYSDGTDGIQAKITTGGDLVFKGKGKGKKGSTTRGLVYAFPGLPLFPGACLSEGTCTCALNPPAVPLTEGTWFFNVTLLEEITDSEGNNGLLAMIEGRQARARVVAALPGVGPNSDPTCVMRWHPELREPPVSPPDLLHGVTILRTGPETWEVVTEFDPITLVTRAQYVDEPIDPGAVDHGVFHMPFMMTIAKQ